MAKLRPILVIEDSDPDFAILEMCLKQAGVPNPIERCAGGQGIKACLDRMETAGADNIPIFIFLDLNLPGTHGSAVLKRVKAHPALASIPIVVLTTSTQSRDVDMSYELGASGFLTKPLDLYQFEKMIHQVAEYWFSCVKLPENIGRAH